MQVYDGFDDWKSVQSYFKMSDPEPDEVYLALYNSPTGWDCEAEVFYRVGDKYYEVGGYHCSCHGLEGQWDPEEYDKDTFICMLERRGKQYYKDIAERIKK